MCSGGFTAKRQGWFMIAGLRPNHEAITNGAGKSMDTHILAEKTVDRRGNAPIIECKKKRGKRSQTK